MYPVVVFQPSSHTGTNTVVVVGDHAVDGTTVRYAGQTLTLTANGATDYMSKLQEIAKYGTVHITG